MNKDLSRRDFLKTMGKGLGSAAVLSAAVPFASAVADEAPAAAAHPFTYVQLDPDETMKRGYESFYKFGGCAAGSFDAIIGQLADKVGYPFNQVPVKMYANGAGGYGAGTLCGSLGGSAGAIGLLCEPADAKKLTAELFDWYCKATFPSYDPEKYAPTTTVSGSVNCSESVTKFMKANGIEEMGADNRKARCAAVTGECARKAVELLNIHFGFAEAPAGEKSEEAPLADNEYIGVGKGYGGDIKVKVTMDGDKIAKIDVLEHSETAGIADAAIKEIPEAVVAAQSTDVVTSATAKFTTNGLMEAINNALAQVKQ